MNSSKVTDKIFFHNGLTTKKKEKYIYFLQPEHKKLKEPVKN